MAQGDLAGELEANRFTVKKLLDLAQRGDLRVPAFQRPPRWRRADHLLLLDSLYRGYPVGTLLLWRRSANAATLRLGEFSVVAPAMPQAYWIVDGQERITSIVGCLLRPDPVFGRRSSEFTFWFDLEEDRFVDGDHGEGRFVPVNRLSDPVATARWAREVGADDNLHKRAQAAGARLRDYEIPAYVTNAESDEHLRVILARTNAAGRPARQEEVFEALNRGFNPSDSESSLTERLRDSVRALSFGTIDNDHLQRALICVAGFNPRVALPTELRAPGAASRFEQETVQALGLTVSFLRDEARLPHAEALPYVLPFVLLPRFFHLYPSPGERTVELLVRWVWRGIAGQTHMATNQQFNPHYKALGAGSEEAVAQAFLKLVSHKPPATSPESALYNPRGMKTKLEFAALYSLGPRSLIDGHELAAVEIFEAEEPPEAPSLFGAETLRTTANEKGIAQATPVPRLPVVDPSLRRLVGARLLHPQIRGDDGAVAAALQHAPSETLRSHGIEADLEPMARIGAWDALVRGRTTMTRALTERTIASLARWNEDDDGPSIESLISDLTVDAEAVP